MSGRKKVLDHGAMTSRRPRRGRPFAVAALAVIASLGVFSGASATKYFDSFFGGSGSGAGAQGGLFSQPRDIDVNDPAAADGKGADGWIYVVDQANNRIQAFDESKDFQFAIGRDVVNGVANPGAAGDTNEIQTITIGGGATGGSFTLSFGTTAPATTADIAFDATAGEVDAALGALGGIGGAANVDVTGPDGGPYTVEFVGARASVAQAAITADPGGLSPSGTATIVTDQDGASFEKCTVASQCKAGLATAPANAALGNGGTFNVVQGIDIDQATGDIFVRERDTNSRVQQFSASGQFIRAFGWDVVASGPGNDTTAPINEFETCNAAAADVCKAGSNGTGLGQFSSAPSPATAYNGIVVSPPGAPTAGEVFVADPGPTGSLAARRINRYHVPPGSSAPVEPLAAIGDATLFGDVAGVGEDHPRHLAIDSQGVLYATAEGSVVGIVRYDTGLPPSEALLQPIEGGSATTPLGTTGNSVTGLEMDPSNDRLYVARTPAAGVAEFDLSAKPSNVTTSHLVDNHASGLSITPNGLGFAPGPDELLITTTSTSVGTGSGARVVVLDDSGVDPPPSPAVLTPTAVGATTATLNAEINPNGPTGFPTSYRFQLSTDGINWVDVGSDESVGDGSTPVCIGSLSLDCSEHRPGVHATDLEANTFYRVRLVTSRSPSAGVLISSELSFLTDAAPPEVDTLAPRQVADASAVLAGRFNPGGLETSYWFEWGDDSFGNRIPIPAANATGSVAREVGERLTGLAPGSAYAYRLCAQNALTPTKVCGAGQSFITHAGVSAPEGRSYEMITAPDKPLRQGHGGIGGADVRDYARANTALPASDVGGTAVRWGLFPGATSGDAGHAFSWAETFEIYDRSAAGWKAEAVTNVPPTFVGNNAVLNVGGSSADLGTSTWYTQDPMFNNAPAENHGSQQAVRVLGDSGGPRAAGWYPWLDPAWYTGGFAANTNWTTKIDDHGARLIAWSPSTQPSAAFHDVTPADGGAAPKDLVPAQVGGRALFLSGPEVDWRPGDLINECTGTVGESPTLIPARDDRGTSAGPPGTYSVLATYTAGNPEISINFNFGAHPQVGHTAIGPGIPPGATVVAVANGGTGGSFTISPAPTSGAGPNAAVNGGQNTAALDDDVIAARPCGAGSPTDTRGAVLRADRHLAGSSVTAMSDDGSRIFFMSPDPAAAEATCSVASGNDTACPPQLFVRQFDGAGDPTVRWISRAEDALFTGPPGPQHPGAMGNGVAFEGASRDGSVVYFRTNAPLLQSDPNGGENRLATASPHSWDLYRYEVGTNTSTDPAAGDPGDRLTRVSGGPNGTADPNTNCPSVVGGSCDGIDAGGTDPNGEGGVARFMSDDGNRLYFVTAAEIPAASNAPPAGGTTIPGGGQVNAETRNLYLYDATKSGAAAYEFVARIPFSSATGSSGSIDSCASFSPRQNGPFLSVEGGSNLLGQVSSASCVHGSSSGDALIFQTTGQLTADDTDTAADIYLYEASTDRLTRISAPPPGASPYVCQRTTPSSPVRARCNGDLGLTARPGINDRGDVVGLAGLRHWNIAEHPDGTLQAVYFESRLPLTPDKANVAGPLEDTGGEGHMDVFEWRDGKLSLITSGDGTDSAFYSGNSRNGDHVFFWTEQPISPWEIDPADGDLYSAAVGGGLPAPPPLPTICAALVGVCQTGDAPPVAIAPRTPAPAAHGNAEAGERKRLSVGRVGSKARRRAARTGRLSLRVRTNSPGRVSVVVRGKLGEAKGKPILARASKRVSEPGLSRVDLRLKRVARDTLRRGRSVRLSIRVRQAGARPRSMTVRLRGPRS